MTVKLARFLVQNRPLTIPLIRSPVVISAVTVLLWIPNAARADAIRLDQAFLPGLNSTFVVGTTDDVQASQVFTVGLTGLLTAVDLWLARETQTTGDLFLAVLPTDVGLPTTDNALALSRQLISAASIPLATPLSTSFIHITIANPIAVVEGDVLALSLWHNRINTADAFHWYGGGNGTSGPIDYLGGSWYYRSENGAYAENVGSDFAFRTYVETTAVPEPSTLLLLTVSLGLLPVTVRRKN